MSLVDFLIRRAQHVEAKTRTERDRGAFFRGEREVAALCEAAVMATIYGGDGGDGGMEMTLAEMLKLKADEAETKALQTANVQILRAQFEAGKSCAFREAALMATLNGASDEEHVNESTVSSAVTTRSE